MSLLTYVKTLRRHWALILILAVLGGGVGFAHAATTPPQFRSSSRVLLTSDLDGTASNISQSTNYLENIVASYVLLADSERVLTPVIARLDLRTSPGALARQVEATSPLNTVIIDISVTASTPQLAQQIASAVTEELAEAVSEVAPRTEAGQAAIRLTTVTPAAVPGSQISPNRNTEILIGVAAGVVLGVGVALVRRFIGNTVHDADDVTEVTTVPLLGEVVETTGSATFTTEVLRQPRGPQAESLRGLVTNLRFLNVDDKVRSMVVTSSSPQEAKSSVSVGLATVIAESGSSVLLIDADLRKPTIANHTNLDGEVGLSDVLAGEYELTELTTNWIQNVDVLLSGPTPPNPAHLLSSAAMQSLVKEAESLYDFVIVDSAPLLAAADAVWLAHATDGALVLARRGRTKTTALNRSLDIMSSGNARLLGIALTRVRSGGDNHYGRYGTYGS